MEIKTLLLTLLMACASSAQALPKGVYFQAVVPPTAPSADPLDSSYAISIAAPVGISTNIYVTDDMTDVRGDSWPWSSNSAIQLSTPGSPAAIFGAKNSVEGLLIHQRADVQMTNWNVTLTSLTLVNPGAAFVIGSTPTDILVHRIGQVNSSTKTNSTAITYTNVTGLMPQYLIPSVDPYFNQTTNAFPYTIPVSSNVSAWIDIHIPSAAPSGYYYGTARVSTGGVVIANIPIEIGVIDFYMASTASYRTYFAMDAYALTRQAYGNDGQGTGAHVYRGVNAVQDDLGRSRSGADMTQFCADHRIGCGGVIYPPYGSGFADLSLYYNGVMAGTTNLALLNGSAPTDSRWAFSGYTSTNASNWLAFSNSNNWLAKMFDYVIDEPGSSASLWAKATSSMTNIALSASPIMSPLITCNYNQALANGATGQILTMVTIVNDSQPNSGAATISTTSVAWALARGSNAQWWLYNDCESGGNCGSPSSDSTLTYCNHHADGVPVAQRCQSWDAFKQGATGELYFDTTKCWLFNTCANGNSPFNGIWPSSVGAGQGDGTMLYPGVDSFANSPSTTSAIFTVASSTPIAMASPQFNRTRDSVQDYEYMVALPTQTVANAISTWMTNSYTFNVKSTATGSFTGSMASARLTLMLNVHRLKHVGGGGPWL